MHQLEMLLWTSCEAMAMTMEHILSSFRSATGQLTAAGQRELEFQGQLDAAQDKVVFQLAIRLFTADVLLLSDQRTRNIRDERELFSRTFPVPPTPTLHSFCASLLSGHFVCMHLP